MQLSITLAEILIGVPLKSITLFLGNVHIYENNIEPTELLSQGNDVKFSLNV